MCVLVRQVQRGSRWIFFLSPKSGIADEVAWDFKSRVVNSKTSFTFFCQDLTRICHTNNPDAKAFCVVAPLCPGIMHGLLPTK